MSIQQFPEELDWVNATLHPLSSKPGSFVTAFCQAALAADESNYTILRPAVRILMEKYPPDEFRLLMERHDSGRSTPEDIARMDEIRKARHGIK